MNTNDAEKELQEYISKKIEDYVHKAIWSFVAEILHGSTDHKQWLQNAAKNFLNGVPIDYNNPYQK